MVAFMLILMGIGGIYSSFFSRKSEKKRRHRISSVIMSIVFIAYGGYITYLYMGGTFGRALLVGSNHKTAFSLVDTIGVAIVVLSIILSRILYRNNDNNSDSP
ncbi:MAG: hypothetical protein ACK5LL_10455 [Suipraeoptans sp.]